MGSNSFGKPFAVDLDKTLEAARALKERLRLLKAKKKKKFPDMEQSIDQIIEQYTFRINCRNRVNKVLLSQPPSMGMMDVDNNLPGILAAMLDVPPEIVHFEHLGPQAYNIVIGARTDLDVEKAASLRSKIYESVMDRVAELGVVGVVSFIKHPPGYSLFKDKRATINERDLRPHLHVYWDNASNLIFYLRLILSCRREDRERELKKFWETVDYRLTPRDPLGYIEAAISSREEQNAHRK